MVNSKDGFESGERIIPEKMNSEEEYLLYLRHQFAYEFVKTQIPVNSSILEVGCGEGYGTCILSQVEGAVVVGIDIDEETIVQASKRYDSDKCTFKLYDASIIPFEANSFDAVVSFQVIEHLHNPKNYISEIYRVLKDSGVFFLTTPNGTMRLSSDCKPWNKFHIKEFSPDELKNLLNKEFRNVNILGIRGSAEVQRIELNRIDNILKKKKSGIWGKLKRKIYRKIMRDRILNKENEKSFFKYNLSDYYVIDKPQDGLDLLGISRKY